MIVVIGAFFIVAEMKCRAYEAAGQVKITRNANATFTGVFDMKGSTIGNSLERRGTGIKPRSAGTIKLNVIKSHVAL